MHKASMDQMRLELQTMGEPGRLIDIGSYDVNGSYRDLDVGMGWHYTGLDVTPGPNVDIIAPELYHYPIDSDSYDAVISGSTMEHVQAIWLWVPELVRILKPGGYLVILTHCQWDLHRFPIDCWRILPDGMEYLFDYTRQLKSYKISMYNKTDIVGRAIKI